MRTLTRGPSSVRNMRELTVLRLIQGVHIHEIKQTKIIYRFCFVPQELPLAVSKDGSQISWRDRDMQGLCGGLVTLQVAQWPFLSLSRTGVLVSRIPRHWWQECWASLFTGYPTVMRCLYNHSKDGLLCCPTTRLFANSEQTTDIGFINQFRNNT